MNAVSTAAVVAGGGLVVAGGGDLMMHEAGDDGTAPARTDYSGSGGDGYEPTDGFRGSEFSKDEFVQFVNGHTGDANPTMDRPTEAEIDEALTKATPERLEGQNAEVFRYGRVKVILNYDMQEAIDGLPEALRDRLAGWVAGVDERFRSYTVDDPRERMAKIAETDLAGRGWWWRRVPETGPIAEDLARY